MIPRDRAALPSASVARRGSMNAPSLLFRLRLDGLTEEMH